MNKFAIMTKDKQVIKPGTKTVWVTTATKTEEITREQYNNIVNSAPWFRRLGGSETLQRAYTSYGYIPYRIISTAPDRSMRTVRQFKFD